ncbi:MAG: AraC family transcriptional regulator [Cyanobacteria bacterium P01_B01_bin.77]
MALELTEANFIELVTQAEYQGEPVYQPLELGSQSKVPSSFGEGGDRHFFLRNGLTISINRCRLKQPLKLIRWHEARFELTAKFYLSGSSRIRTLDANDIETDYEEIRGHHYLYHLPNQTEIEEWPADELIHLVFIWVDPTYFSTFNAGATALSATLRKLLEGDKTQRFHQPLGQMTPYIKQLLQQILHCPYTGLMQQAFLEGKALELFTAQFAIWSEMPSSKASIALSAYDIEQLHQAKEILIQQVKQPPTLLQLARQVGLNDNKLKQGFRHLFGTTAFGYLRDYRLQQAQLLLQKPNLTIAKVATTVGYRSPAAFCNAFRRKFGVSPKAYQLDQRG